VAGIFKRMAFGDVKIVEIIHLHVGLKGTMDALFLKDLADKTRAACAAVSKQARPAAAALGRATW